MAARRRVVVVGARGVFGSLLVRELANDFDVVEGTRHQLDFRGAFAVACAAGPFQQLDRGMVRDAVSAGAHWLDIADDAGWFFDLLDDQALDALARQMGVAVIPGLSSLPAISGALARKLDAKQVAITLFIGNANRKGAAAMISAAELNPPDRELLRRELGVDATVDVAFELPLAAPMLRLLGKLPRNARTRVAKLLSRVPLRFGTSGGRVEVRSGDSRRDRQRQGSALRHSPARVRTTPSRRSQRLSLAERLRSRRAATLHRVIRTNEFIWWVPFAVHLRDAYAVRGGSSGPETSGAARA